MYFRSTDVLGAAEKSSLSGATLTTAVCSSHRVHVLLSSVLLSVLLSAVPSRPSALGHVTPERLSSGVFEFGRLRVTGDGGQRGEAGGGRRALTLHEHGVQTSHFGSEERVNAVEHGEEVGELQLLWEKRNERRWRDNNNPPFPPPGESVRRS